MAESKFDALSKRLGRRKVIKGGAGLSAAAMGLGAFTVAHNALTPDMSPATAEKVEELLAIPGYANPHDEHGNPIPMSEERIRAIESHDIEYFRARVMVPVDKPGEAAAGCNIWTTEYQCYGGCGCGSNGSYYNCRLATFWYCSPGPSHWTFSSCRACQFCSDYC
jgi:hypothetical protein